MILNVQENLPPQRGFQSDPTLSWQRLNAALRLKGFLQTELCSVFNHSQQLWCRSSLQNCNLLPDLDLHPCTPHKKEKKTQKKGSFGGVSEDNFPETSLSITESLTPDL